jgi:enoyl-CoA hydratase/carnithine racemase
MELIYVALIPVLNSLKDSYEQALRRDDVKAIVITGNY